LEEKERARSPVAWIDAASQLHVARAGIPMPFVRFSTILFMLAIEDTKDNSMTLNGKPLSIEIRGMRHDGDERGRASRPTETTREPPLGC